MVVGEKKSGKVKWFNPQKGFGFITDDDPLGKDIFVHISSVERSGLTFLFEGQALHFEVAPKDGKRAAHNLSAIETESLAESGFSVDQRQSAVATVEVLRSCTSQLIDHLQKNPDDIYRIHPAAFEELVAKIFENDGFVVEFNKAWNQADGGVDIIAVRKEGGIPWRLAIQCKRYSRDNRITAEPIRSLCGVLDRYRAHAGVLATTSYFTKPAKEEARNHMWRVGLHDFEDIVSGLMKLKTE